MQSRHRVCSWVCVVTLVFAAGLANAQQRRGFFGGAVGALRVAAVPEVAQELKLSEEQTELVTKLNAELNEQGQELFQNVGDISRQERQERFQKYTEQRAKKEEQLAKSVGKEKFQRMQQLSVQAGREMAAFLDRQTAEKLEITDDQRNTIRESFGGLREKFSAAGDDEQARAKLLTKINEDLAAVLTDEQKSKWKELKGKPASEELLAKIRAATSRGRRRTD
jgi:hypothetical protein